MGPIRDMAGVEQGGIPSGEEFQLLSNYELDALNSSGLGFDMGCGPLGGIGAADDEVVLSDNPYSLQCLLNLAQKFCNDNCMKLVSSKTHLLLFAPKNWNDVKCWKLSNPVQLDHCFLPFSSQAEHVGVVRSSNGSNLPAITSRISAHTKSIFRLLECGGARSHRGNPAASLAVERLYSAPTLYSGLAVLVLSKSELKVLTQHQKVVLQQLQKLYSRTPRAVVHFLSGSIPAPGLLAMKKLSLLGMIARLGPSNILYRQALFSLHHLVKSSWFYEVRELCALYSLPDPLLILLNPPSKTVWKNSVKEHVIAFWHHKLSVEVESRPSLCFLRPHFLPLNGQPHMLWLSCESSRTAVRAATVVARLLLGRYRHDLFRSNQSNKL